LAEKKRTEENASETPIRIWLLNEKEAIEKVLKESGEDMFQQEVDRFVQRINDDKAQIYSRRSDIKGVGMVYVEGIRFADLLTEAIHAYMLGMYNSAISLSCIAAERFCYDFIDISNITLNSKELDNKTKSYLYKIPFTALVEFFADLNVIDKKAKKLLMKIGSNIRNDYLHPIMKSPQDLKKHSLDALNLMCELAKHRLSILNFYEIVDGKLTLKPQYR